MVRKESNQRRELTQRERFVETAHELGTDQDADALDRVFGKVAPPIVPEPAEKAGSKPDKK